MKRSHAMPMEPALTQPSQELNESHVCDWKPVYTDRHAGPKECAADGVCFVVFMSEQAMWSIAIQAVGHGLSRAPSPIETCLLDEQPNHNNLIIELCL